MSILLRQHSQQSIVSIGEAFYEVIRTELVLFFAAQMFHVVNHKHDW